METTITILKDNALMAVMFLATALYLGGDIQDLRDEMAGEFRAVREEMAEEFKAVREEMAEGFMGVRSEIARANERLARTETRLDGVEDGLARVETRLGGIEGRLYTDTARPPP